MFALHSLFTHLPHHVAVFNTSRYFHANCLHSHFFFPPEISDVLHDVMCTPIEETGVFSPQTPPLFAIYGQ